MKIHRKAHAVCKYKARLTKNEQKKMKEIKNGYAIKLPQLSTSPGTLSSHFAPSAHPNMINCQFSPVADLLSKDDI